MAAEVVGYGFLRAAFWPHDADEKSFKRVSSRVRALVPFADRQKIYHYTNCDALVNIVRDRGFWLSQSTYMNDSTEIEHGTEIACDIVDRLAKKPRYDPMRGILGEVLRQLRPPRPSDYYIACFTLEEDSLEQWRAYSPTGGVNIELSPTDHGTYGGDLGVWPRMLLWRVFYDDADKRMFVFSLVRKYLAEYVIDLEQYKDNRAAMYEEEYARSIVSEIKFRLPSFKHSAFASERELRLVVTRSETQRFAAIHERVRSGKIIPYLKSNEWSEKVPPPADMPPPPPLNITSIIVGPQPERDLVIRSIRDFMQRNDYPEVDVRPSKVPYRTV